MVLLQRGTTRLAGRVDAVKNENIPHAAKVPKGGVYNMYITPWHTVHTVYLAFGSGRRGRRGRGLVYTDAATL